MPSPTPESATTSQWETFARATPDLDPGATITLRDHGRTAGPTGDTDASATLRDLPALGVAEGGAARADFEVTGVLGEGGMGRVLLARQRSLARDVAVKTIKVDADVGPAAATLLAEAIVTGSLEHPTIVPIHALGRDGGGLPVLVMKRIEGVRWRDLARDPDHPLWETLMPEREARFDVHLDILMTVCNALHFAHSRGVVHRDVKLDNVMIGRFGEVYLCDWGIAMRYADEASGTREPRAEGEWASTVGTPSYMPPELVAGDVSRMDPRTDVYLLGATLHALLTGKSRHRGETLYDVLLSAHESAPFDYGPDVPTELAALCNKATSRAREERFPTALALRQEIASCRRHRASNALAEEASARLAEADAARAEGAPSRRLHAILTECRFGFVQALRSWKENATARSGLQRCLETMIDHEIAQRDAEGARALFAELPTPVAELDARIAVLEAELADAGARVARLQAIEFDQDPTVGSGAQLGLWVLFLGTTVAVFVAMIGKGAELSRLELTIAPAIVLVLVALGAWFSRKRLKTAISRRAIGIVLMTTALISAHRVLGFMVDPSVGSMLLGDTLLAALGTATIAICFIADVGWALIPYAIGAIAVTRWPDRALLVFALTLTSGVGVLVVLWRRAIAKGTRARIP